MVEQSEDNGVIPWSRWFDSIWSIRYTGYPDRMAGIDAELKRIGVTDSGILHEKLNFPSITDAVMFNFLRANHRTDCRKQSQVSCSLGHYSCIKSAYELGHEHMLVIEDDERFLKNTDEIAEYLSFIPSDADIVNFDVLPADAQHNDVNFPQMMERDSINSRFFRYHMMFGGGCYALNRKAMGRLIDSYERFMRTADDYLSGRAPLGNDIIYCASKKSICCQLTFSNSVNVGFWGTDTLHGIYRKKHLDYSEYNIVEKEGFTYGDYI